MKDDSVIKGKVARVLQKIFGYSVMICLLVGGFSFFGYLFAIIVGGRCAELICEFIYDILYPNLVRLSTVTILLGLVKMYICGEVALSNRK